MVSRTSSDDLQSVSHSSTSTLKEDFAFRKFKILLCKVNVVLSRLSSIHLPRSSPNHYHSSSPPSPPTIIMLRENYLLVTSLILIHFVQTLSYAKHQNPSCNPSACGNIHNISYPFRLKNDPKDCGDPAYEISCENNTPSINMDSHRFHVKTINYHNHTIHFVDPVIKNNDSCSFPMYSLVYNSLVMGSYYPYSTLSYISYGAFQTLVQAINFFSCPFPVNDSAYTETEECVDRNSNTSRHTYIVVGEFYRSNLRDMCRFDNAVLTSFPFKHENNISLLEIHESLLYGFELSWFAALCGGDCSICEFDGKKAYCADNECSTLSCGYHTWQTVICWILVILIYASMSFALRMLIGMPIMLYLLIYKLRRRHLSVFDLIESFLQNHNNLMPIRYSYSDIKKMTRGFREKLGQGGYGSVYRGKLRSGSIVAVKVLNKPRGDGQDFINEVATIGRIHHVNVVKLVGYCAERSKCALVYDFMPNGSLDKYLFSRQESDGNSLSWERKYNIAVGVARGIDYLHRGCDIQILHFDIKPHNILLDENFIPRISDFGLAKSYSTEKNTITLTAARGTIGYVAPELMNRSIGGVSYKADVYSFGMLLMEMVDLNKDMAATDHSSSQYFPDWIYDRFSKHKDIEIGKLDDDYTRKITRKLTIIALWCIQMSPSDRPSMSKVLEMLESETELLQIPLQHFQSPNVAGNAQDETWGTDSTDSIALLHTDHDASFENHR